MKSIRLADGDISYRLSGAQSNPCLVIETGTCATCAEWWHLADEWSGEFRVLAYDRPGYGQSGGRKGRRTPDDIAHGLNALMASLGIDRAVMLGHSMGGLYVYRFAMLYPHKTRALVLVDPVSPENGRFRKELTKQEFAKSGADKSAGLKLGKLVCTIGLGRLLRPLIRKSPPFYFYNGFSKDAEEHILRNSTSGKMYDAALREYMCIEDAEEMGKLAIVPGGVRAPLYLICHTPEVMEREIEAYGGADARTSARIEKIWQEIMREYLRSSPDSHFIQAAGSGHSIHLTDPHSVRDAIRKAASGSGSAGSQYT